MLKRFVERASINDAGTEDDSTSPMVGRDAAGELADAVYARGTKNLGTDHGLAGTVWLR